MKNSITLSVMALLFGIACSGAGTGTSATVTGAETNSGSVIAAVFGSVAQASISSQTLRAAVKNVESQISTTCDAISGDPASVTSSAVDPDFSDPSVTSKDYGPEGSSVTLVESDFCEDSNGNSNSGTGLYAYFVLNADVEASCNDGSSATMQAGSEGVWFQDGTTACPEIYGTFLMTDNQGTEFTAQCHILLSCDSQSSEITDATCTDENGASITLDSSTTCEINAQ